MPFLFVLFFGLIININNSGGLTSAKQAKSEIVHSLKNPQVADWSKLNQ